MITPMEIHIKDGQCKVIEGEARRVYFTTEEALGLAMLRLNPHVAGGTVALDWADFLGDRGVAMALSGNRALALMRYPATTRSIQYHRGTGSSLDFAVTTPPLLVAAAFVAQKLVKTQLWVIKAGFEDKLSVTGTDNVLSMFPYGNVYSHGGICWGSTPLKDIHQPNEVVGAFFSSGFNGDLYTPSYMGVSEQVLLSYLQRITANGTKTGVLNLPIETAYVKSVAAVVQDISRM